VYFHEKLWSSFALGLNPPKEEDSGGNPPRMVRRVPVVMNNRANQNRKRLKIFDAITQSTEEKDKFKLNNCNQIPMLSDKRNLHQKDKANSILFEEEFDKDWSTIENFYTGRLQ